MVNTPILIPEEFHCPITHEIMKDPVVTCDGQSYERFAIQEWFHRTSSARTDESVDPSITSPKTNETLTSTTLIPNHALRNIIEKYSDNTVLLQQQLHDLRKLKEQIEEKEKEINQNLSIQSDLVGELKKRKRFDECDETDQPSENISLDNVITQYLSKKQARLDLQYDALKEALLLKEEEHARMTSKREVLLGQMTNNPLCVQIEGLKKTQKAEYRRLKQIRDSLEKRMCKLATEYRETLLRALGQSTEASDEILEAVRKQYQEPQKSSLLQEYADQASQLFSTQAALHDADVNYQNIIAPLEEEMEMNKSIVNQRLQEITDALPVIKRDQECLQIRVNSCEDERKSIQKLASDIRNAVLWAQNSSRGLYEVVESTLPTILLLFQMHCQLKQISAAPESALQIQIADIRDSLSHPGVTNAPQPRKGLGFDMIDEVISMEDGSSDDQKEMSTLETPHTQCMSMTLKIEGLRRRGMTTQAAKLKGYTLEQLYQAKYQIHELLQAYKEEELINEGIPVRKIQKIRQVEKELIEKRYDVFFLRQNGFSPRELLAAGYPDQQLIPEFPVQILLESGVPISSFKKLRYTFQHFKKTNISREEFDRS